MIGLAIVVVLVLVIVVVHARRRQWLDSNTKAWGAAMARLGRLSAMAELNDWKAQATACLAT